MFRTARIIVVLVAILAAALCLPAGAGATAESGNGGAGVDQLLAEAARARRAGEMEKAAAFYARVLDLDPGHRLALYNAGIILENAGRFDLAVGVWSRALAADAGDIYAYEHYVRHLPPRDLDAAIEIETGISTEHPGAVVPRLRLALALRAGGHVGRAAAVLEELLGTSPASNIAFLFLKDIFATREQFMQYLASLDQRAMAAGAPENLRLLHLRFLLDRGRHAEARDLALGEGWTTPLARSLLVRAGLRQAGAGEAGAAAAAPGLSSIASQAPAEPRDDGDRAAASAAADDAVASPQPATTAPDFGPADPRAAPRLLERSEQARAEQDTLRAVDELRLALEAAPLLIQPRMLLALMLEQEGHGTAARQALQGPVEPSPWDLYIHAWRTVRDEFIDPDHGGVDIRAFRRRAWLRVKSIEDAKAEIVSLLTALPDPYAHYFAPEVFAGYILSPNAGRAAQPVADQVASGDTWLDLPAMAGSGDTQRDGGGQLATGSEEPSSGHQFMVRADVDVPPAAQQAAEADAGAGLSARRPAAEGSGPQPAAVAGSAPPAEPPAEPPPPRAAAVAPPPPGAPIPRDPAIQSAALGPDIGYIKIPSLNAFDVPARLDRALAHLSHTRALILDLRENGGGDGDVAVAVASRFLAPGTEVCTYQGRRGPSRLLAGGPGIEVRGVPLAILIDGVTASAAEILAAALRDGVGATLIGEATAGKAHGQRALLLADGSGLSLTRVRLQSPAGASWDGTGLQPDIPAAAVRQPGSGVIIADVPLNLAHQELLRRLGVDGSQ